jgi:hypothetical protein
MPDKAYILQLPRRRRLASSVGSDGSNQDVQSGGLAPRSETLWGTVPGRRVCGPSRSKTKQSVVLDVDVAVDEGPNGCLVVNRLEHLIQSPDPDSYHPRQFAVVVAHSRKSTYT